MHQDRLIHWLLSSLELETTLFHLGQYCGSWRASTTGLARSGFHLVLHGRCWLHLPASGTSIPLQGGDGVVFLQDIDHVLSDCADPLAAAQAPRQEMEPVGLGGPGVADRTALACGFFDFRTALGPLFLAPLPEFVVIRRDGKELAEVGPLLTLIAGEASSGADIHSPLIRRLVDLMFFYVIRHVCTRESVQAGLWSLLAQPGLSPVLQAIIAEPARDWTVETMASLAHMSRATFHKRFAEVSGHSPSQLLLRVRMGHAARLMADGESIARTAELVGYQSEAAFSRAFKKAVGQQPGAYRRSRLGSCLKSPRQAA